MSTKTLPISDVAVAKKQRDVLRTRFRTDITKYCDKFDVTQFEAAHAIMDLVLSQINQHALTHIQCALPNNLAQTLLTDTQALIDAQSNEPTKPTHPLDGGVPNWSQFQGHTQPIPPKIKLPLITSDEPLLKDIAVTLGDCAETKRVATALDFTGLKIPQWKVQHGGYYMFVWGKRFYPYAGTLPKEFKPGWNYVLFQVLRTKPYITAKDRKLYRLYPPTGYKWQKLKNKPIFKLVADPKQIGHWAKPNEAKNATSSFGPDFLHGLLNGNPANPQSGGSSASTSM